MQSRAKLITQNVNKNCNENKYDKVDILFYITTIKFLIYNFV